MLSKGQYQAEVAYPKLQNHIKEAFLLDTSAREAFTRGFLNITAYARVIQASVSGAVGRQVSIPAIVMALRRMQKHHSHYVQPTPIVRDVSVWNGLAHCRYTDMHVARLTEAWVQRRGGSIPITLNTKEGIDLFFPMDHLAAFSQEPELHTTMTAGEVDLAIVSFRLENPEALSVILQTIFSLPLVFRYTFFDNDRVTLVVFDEQVPILLQKFG